MTTGVKPVESVQAIPQGEMDALLLGRIKVWIEFQIEKLDNSNLFLIQNYLFFSYLHFFHNDFDYPKNHISKYNKY
jgi:hypothetical protein